MSIFDHNIRPLSTIGNSISPIAFQSDEPDGHNGIIYSSEARPAVGAKSTDTAYPGVSRISTPKSADDVSGEPTQVSPINGPSTNPLRDILAKLTHLDLAGKITYDNSTIKAHGGYCDVFLGEYAAISPNIKVAVKRLRIHAQGSHDFAKVRRRIYINLPYN